MRCWPFQGTVAKSEGAHASRDFGGAGGQSAWPTPTAAPKLQALRTARRVPLAVSRNDSLRHAETQMLLEDHSQLAVTTGERTVHGLISWRSTGRAHVVGAAGQTVADCTDSHVRVLSAKMPLLPYVGEIIRYPRRGTNARYGAAGVLRQLIEGEP